METSDIIPELIARGVQADVIYRITRLIAAAEKLEWILSDRESARKRKQLQRSRHVTVTGQSQDPLPLLRKVPPDPPKESPPPPSRGARLAANWEPSAADIEFARSLIGQQWHIERDKFRDYWQSLPGQKGRKLNWSMAWRNWVRNSKPAKANGKGSVTEFKSNTLMDLWDDRRSKAP